MILFADSEGPDGHADLGLHCPHIAEEMFLYGEAQMIMVQQDFYLLNCLYNWMKHNFFFEFGREIVHASFLSVLKMSLRNYIPFL